MLVMKFEPDQIVKITIGGVVVRLRLVDWYRNRVAIEAPADVPIERFQIQVGTQIRTLEQLERETGTKVAGPGTKNSEAPGKRKEEPKS